MGKLLITVAVFLFGWIGWWIGSRFGGVTTAYFSSFAGSLVGVYVGWRVNRYFLD